VNRQAIARFFQSFGAVPKKIPATAATGGDFKTNEQENNLMNFDTQGKTEQDAAGQSRTLADKRPLTNILRDGIRVLITPALAERIAKECWYEPQGHRGNSPKHISLLASEMTHGRFSGGTQIHFARIGGRLYLVDGNHRVRAVAESGVSVEFSILIDDVEGVSAIGPLYWRHDFIQRARPMVLAGLVAGGGSLCRQHLSAALSAVPLLTGGFARTIQGTKGAVQMRSPDARLAAFKPWKKYAEQYFAGFSGLRPSMAKKLKRAGVVAVAMATYKYQPEMAASFWSAVIDDDGLRRGDPRKTLVRHLNESSMRGGAMDQADGFVAPALCWNAFFEKRELTVLKLGTANFYIAGTPFERKFIKRGEK